MFWFYFWRKLIILALTLHSQDTFILLSLMYLSILSLSGLGRRGSGIGEGGVDNNFLPVLRSLNPSCKRSLLYYCETFLQKMYVSPPCLFSISSSPVILNKLTRTFFRKHFRNVCCVTNLCRRSYALSRVPLRTLLRDIHFMF